MFTLADNKQIGAYLRRTIDRQGYPSVRQFGKACLEEANLPSNDEELRKMSNRLSQILKGKKGVQLEDLPVFSKLLDISCEEILSAGTCVAPSSSHVTNYSTAMSADEREWEAFIQREDQLILNADEYGKTVIDYALAFRNYRLLKYLTDHRYIWFVGTDEMDLFNYNFGAGTSIERNPLLLHNLNVLDAKMKERYDLRMKMIILAIQHGDTKMLTELRAREIPTLYQACSFSCTPAECERYFDEELIEALTNASDEILEYFSKEYEIVDRIGTENRFMFPFISQLISALLETKNDYVQWMLKNAIKHNQYVRNRLADLLEVSADYYRRLYGTSMQNESIKTDIVKSIMRDIDFYEDGNLVSYRTVLRKDGIITNLVKVEGTSDDVQTRHLIQEVNELYEEIRKLVPNI